MSREYDLVVIGSGSAGATIAFETRAAGLNVAVLESRQWGGTCPLRGCNPKKILVGAAEIVARSANMHGKGLRSQAEMDWRELIHFKESMIGAIPKETEKAFTDAGIDTYHGHAQLTGQRSIQVGQEALTGRYIAICTGAFPKSLGISGEEYVSTSDSFFDLETMPDSITFIGGGYISFELSHISARAGSQVVILARGDAVLRKFDQDLVGMLVQEMEEIGVDIRLNMPIRGIERRGSSFVVRAGENGEIASETGLVIHGAGRVFDIDSLGLEKADVSASPRGVSVNGYMQSISSPSIYAAGDAAETPFPLTPTAHLEAEVVAHNIIHGNTRKVDHTGTPSVVFTVPPLASVGMSEGKLREQRIEYRQIFKDTSSWFSSQRIGLNHSGIKVLTDRNSEQILGAHMLGHHAEEAVNLFALAIRHKLTVDQLKQSVWSFPSSVHDIRSLLS